MRIFRIAQRGVGFYRQIWTFETGVRSLCRLKTTRRPVYNRRSPTLLKREETRMSSSADDLPSTYAAHLDTVVRRTSRALESAGFSSLLVHSGSAPMIFADDQHYPFRVNAAFKLWAPLTDVPDCFVYFEPGRKPRLLFHHPRDYWHKPADLPDTFWTHHFELHAVSDRATDPRLFCPKNLSRTAYLGEAFPELEAWNVGAGNPETLVSRLDFARAAKTPYELACLREASRLGALGHIAARKAFDAGASEYDIENRLSRSLRPARAGAAVQPDHRAQQERRGAALPGAGAARPGGAALTAHRCGRGFRGLRERYHAHVFGHRCRLRKAGGRHGSRSAVALRRACTRVSTGATCTCLHIG